MEVSKIQRAHAKLRSVSALDLRTETVETDSFRLILPFVCEFLDLVADSTPASNAFLDFFAITLSSLGGLFLLIMVVFDPSIYPQLNVKSVRLQTPGDSNENGKEMEVKVSFVSMPCLDDA
ncbi:hypothetical protein HDU97_002330 [Phlyctochytrium planicorne]|nr:hypothetical protein HDU97_002330 [Phlyctochytrium planicorne]